MAAWLYVLLLVLVLPYLALRSARVLISGERTRPARSALHFNALAVLTVLLGLSVAVARREDVDLFPAWRPGWIDLGAGAGFLALTLFALARRIARLGTASRARLELITMTNWRDPRQLLPYAAVCVMAGVAEEAAYRGVLTMLLAERLGLVAAIVIACIAFGLAHAVQGAGGIVLTALFAVLFHLMVLTTGSLYTAMVAHCVYDLVAGVTIAEIAMRRGSSAQGGLRG